MRRRIAFLALLCALTGAAAHPQIAADSAAVKPVTVAELRTILRADSGKVVLLNVWATWCKWCKEEMPGILSLRRTLGPEGVAVILLSADDLDDLERVVIPTARSLGITFPTYIMHDSTDEAFISGLSPTWNGALPTTFLFGRSGALEGVLVGERTAAELGRSVRRILR